MCNLTRIGPLLAVITGAAVTGCSIDDDRGAADQDVPVSENVLAIGVADLPAPGSIQTAIEGYAAYDSSIDSVKTCSSGSFMRPGTRAFSTYLARFGITGNTYDSCQTGFHPRGMALDVLISGTAAKQAFADWLTANHSEMARRLGLVQVIWQNAEWRSYNAGPGRPQGAWGTYGGSDPHTDHVHISFGELGAQGATSFFRDVINGGGGGVVSGPPLGVGQDPSEKFDLNGDGRADVCGRSSAGIHCALSSGSGFGATSLWTTAFSDAGGWNAGPELYSTIRFPDVNGDRRADVCGRGTAGIYCALSSGTSFGPVSLWRPEFSDAGGWNQGPQNFATIDFPDVNGDGKADVCGRGSPGIYCALSSGSSFAPASLWRPEFSDAGGWTATGYWSTIRFPDVNGDGKADVCGRGGSGIYCALSSGSSFAPASLWRSEFSDAGGWNAGREYFSTIRFPDVNGDGKADVCGRSSAGIHCGLSSGTSFAPTTLWIAEFSNAGGWNATAAYYSTIAFADLNGDRRADVCGRGSSGMYCALSSGTGFAPTSLWVAAFADAGDWNVGPHYYSTIRLTDVTGDGKADVCGRGSPGIYCAASSGAGFGAATVWLGEFSDGGGWAASPAYYSTIRLP